MSERKVLVIEDSPTMRQLTGFALRRVPGLRLLEAQNGADALTVLEENDVDLILLDINMPVMDGFGFLERLTERYPTRPPVVIITTETAEEDIQRAGEFGIAAYVLKPVQATVLANTVKQILEGGSIDGE